MIIWLAAVIVIMKTTEMIRSLRSGDFGVDLLAIIAIIACLCLGEFWATYLIILMLCSGEALERLANRRAARELSALIKRRPQTAHIVHNDAISDIPLSKIQIGNTLLIKANEVVPVDGKLISDHAVLNESSLTGESMPVDKQAGDSIISGTACHTDAIKIRVTATADDSYYSQIIKLVSETANRPARFVNLANRYAIPFTILSLLIAGLAWALSGSPRRFAEVLVVASPCPLILAAPIAFIAGISRCSGRGIIVKGGDTLEHIAQADVFAFDKTGTITTNQIAISQIDTWHGYTAEMIIAIAAAAESVSLHVLAASIIDYAHQHHIQPAPAHSIREATGDGIFATIDQRRIVVGSPKFLLGNRISLPSNIRDHTSVLVAVNGQCVGAIYFSDTIRRGTKTALRNLHRLGVRENIILTGDRTATANRIGHEVGVNRVFSQMSPTDKVAAVERYQREHHHVAMIGDGINDAPVLAAADVGVAMGVMGSTIAGESADAVITSSHISRIVELRHIAQRTIVIAKQSVLTGVAICLLLEIAALCGFIPIVLGALLQEVVDVISIINALRARRA